MFKINECKKLMKKCKHCNKVKMVKYFRKQKDCIDGYRNKCKECSTKIYTYTCQYCGKEFKGDSKKPKYCSRKCMGLANSNSLIIQCEQCGKEIKIKPSLYKTAEHHFCSLKCRSLYKSINESGKNNINYKRITFKCEICGKEVNQIESHYNKCSHHYCSKECSNKGWTLHYSGENNPLYGKKRPDMLGENNPSWNKDLSDEDRIHKRISEELKKWKNTVLERDNYTCQITGKRGGELNVHHLNGYHWDKENRTNVDNGITLSKEIHELFHHIYGYKNNTKEQFEEFKQRYINKEFKEVI